MGPDERFLPHFLGVGKDGVVQVDISTPLTIDKAIDYLHVVNEVVFKVFVLELLSKKVVDLL